MHISEGGLSGPLLLAGAAPAVAGTGIEILSQAVLKAGPRNRCNITRGWPCKAQGRLRPRSAHLPDDLCKSLEVSMRGHEVS